MSPAANREVMIEHVRIAAPIWAPAGEMAAYIAGSALVVDPASEAATLHGHIDEAGVPHVAVTNHHPDHIGAVAAYRPL